ncbi:MAG: thioesterase family protein [Microthrixaceae bacterium]
MPSDDAKFLGLTAGEEPGGFGFVVEDHLARMDGRLYGGTAIAVSIAAAELVTQRSPLWMTTQFVATAPADERVSVLAEVLAAGRRTSQVRVTGTNADGDIMFASLGATGIPQPSGLHGVFERAPSVEPPDDSVPWTSPIHGMLLLAGIEAQIPELPDFGFTSAIDIRHPAIVEHPDPGPGRVCLWIRRRDRVPISPAVAAYLADMVPMSVAHALGALAGGLSLDNTIRIGPFVDTEWVLVDLRPHLAMGDYGHGAAHLWSESGALLATASQSASMFQFAEAFPWKPTADGPPEHDDGSAG